MAGVDVRARLGFVDMRDLCALIWVERCEYDHTTYVIDARSWPAQRMLHRHGVHVYYSELERRVKLYLDGRYGWPGC